MASVVLGFDEETLVKSLRPLPLGSPIALALRIAERSVHVCRSGSRSTVYSSILLPAVDSLWAFLEGASIEVQQILDQVIEHLPDSDGESTIQDALDDHAIAALAYALRCAQSTDSAQEAAWAARRAYEAVDQAVVSLLDTLDEARILRHEWVQRELGRQQRDLVLVLANASVPSLIRAVDQHEELLTGAELQRVESANAKGRT
jgi:hypothetical protein